MVSFLLALPPHRRGYFNRTAVLTVRPVRPFCHQDFCPNWQKHERIALAALLAREAGRGHLPQEETE